MYEYADRNSTCASKLRRDEAVFIQLHVSGMVSTECVDQLRVASATSSRHSPWSHTALSRAVNHVRSWCAIDSATNAADHVTSTANVLGATRR